MVEIERFKILLCDRYQYVNIVLLTYGLVSSFLLFKGGYGNKPHIVIALPRSQP